MINIIGVIISFAYFYATLFISYKFRRWHECSRKFAHIMIGNWYFLSTLLFENLVYALITPAVFVIFGSCSIYKKRNDLITSLLRKGRNSSIGVILFPIALMLMLTVSIVFFQSFIPGGIAIIALTYGDSAAAIIGSSLPVCRFNIWNSKKSLSGCFSMLMFSTVFMYLYGILGNRYYPLNISFPFYVVMGIVATLTELITPSDYDNITIPAIIFLVYYFFS